MSFSALLEYPNKLHLLGDVLGSVSIDEGVAGLLAMVVSG